MNVFITGGSGWIGSGIIRELRSARHEVTALARTDEAIAAVTGLGAIALRGDIRDREILRSAAASADAVIHCAFDHRFGASDLLGAILVRLTRSPAFARVSRAGRTDLHAIEALAAGLADSRSAHKVLVTTGPIAGLQAGKTGTEADRLDPSAFGGIRIASELATLAATERGIRSASVRLPPSVHGVGDTGFVAQLAQVARSSGVAGYLGDGENRWAAVHRDDAATLYRLAIEGLANGTVPAGSVLHGIAEVGVPFRQIANALATGLSVPAASVKKRHFPAFLGMVAGLDITASSDATRRLTGWTPTRRDLLADVVTTSSPSR